MLLGHVVKLDPLAMFLNCLCESSLSYRSLPTWLDLVPMVFTGYMYLR